MVVSLTSRRTVRRAGLVFASDQTPGIVRERHGQAFRYIGPSGRRLRSAVVLARIAKLAIPPAWKKVWICRDSRGHIQATGLDARGRKQYLYHADWTAERGATKFDRLEEFAKALPAIRRQVARDLRLPGLPRERVLAAVVSLLERTLIRVGNDEYAKTNRSYGATTLRKRHVSVRGTRVRFEFLGKSGVQHDIEIRDPRLSRIVRSCQELPGQELFEYVGDDGEVCRIRSTDVNDYLRDITGSDFTAKDFRTWAGTVLAARELNRIGPFDTKAMLRRNIAEAVRQVARELGNTAAVCRQGYIHPAILDTYGAGELPKVPVRQSPFAGAVALSVDERWVLRLLHRSPAKTKSRAA